MTKQSQSKKAETATKTIQKLALIYEEKPVTTHDIVNLRDLSTASSQDGRQRLNNSKLPRIQRQQIAGQLGQLQGNHVLHQTIEQASNRRNVISGDGYRKLIVSPQRTSNQPTKRLHTNWVSGPGIISIPSVSYKGFHPDMAMLQNHVIWHKFHTIVALGGRLKCMKFSDGKPAKTYFHEFKITTETNVWIPQHISNIALMLVLPWRYKSVLWAYRIAKGTEIYLSHYRPIIEKIRQSSDKICKGDFSASAELNLKVDNIYLDFSGKPFVPTSQYSA